MGVPKIHSYLYIFDEALFMKMLVACIFFLATISMGCVSSEINNVLHPFKKNNTPFNGADNQQTSQLLKQAFLHLENEKVKYNLHNPKVQLKLISVNVDKLEKKHLKFQQVYQGVSVWGRQVLVHLDEDNSVYRVSGEVLEGLNTLNIIPAISLEEAGIAVQQSEQWGRQGWKIKKRELSILEKNGKKYLTYRLTITKGLMREFLFVNANDATIIHRITGTQTLN
ncbi:MAG: hypothetical protein QNK31_04880 [Porticoccus sp.]|nr:hypothetical protein [Porticoccus sp.]